MSDYQFEVYLKSMNYFEPVKIPTVYGHYFKKLTTIFLKPNNSATTVQPPT